MGNCDSAPSSRRSSRSSSSRQGLRRVSSEVKIGRAGSLSRSMPRRLDSVNSSPRRMESVGSAGGHSQLKAIVSMRKRQAELEKRGSTASTMVKTEEKRSLGDTGKTWSYALKKPPPNPWESTTDDYDKYLNQYSLMCDRDGVEAFDKWKEDKGLDELGDMIPESSCSDSDEEFACSVKFQPPVHAKAGHELRTITRCLRTSALFTKLRDEEFEVFAKAAQTVGFRKGEEVFKHGSIPLPSKAGLYCIAEGRVGLNSQGLVMNSLCPGQCFGEQTAVSPSLRSNCTVVTQSPVTCYFIPSDVCLPLLGQHEEARRNEYLAIMDNIEYLKGLKRVQLIRLCDLLEEVAYKKDETIIEFNKQATHFYFILQGTVKVVGREAVSDTIIPTVTKHICDCKEGDPLGHLEMFELPSVSCANDPFDTTPVVKEAPRSIADVIATSEEVITARLSKSDFESCLTSTAEPLKDMVGRSADYAYYRDTAGMAFPEEKKPVVLSHPKYSMQRHVNRP
eukprot:TRINITY_DN454_c3_g2_i2.p1 TRINITY_DN454_c3_g2~~TRINITY_DN454_c3_g2_i2.p1  ORF type:complete len:507 (+),score=159.74 TRINITY_DN454_c3_g2_i2:864-2384(+)